MEYNNKEFCLEVTGRYACFTRPEFKVERVSYDVITPSAVRGIFEAILWKPSVRWIPTRIEVLSPLGKWASIQRNEVAGLASTRVQELFAEDRRQQKSSQVLKDVHYRIHAELEYVPISKRLKEHRQNNSDVKDDCISKYNSMFERRAAKGQHFMHPYLGCREFSCSRVRLVVDAGTEKVKPIKDSYDFGYMLFDQDYSDPANTISLFYRAQMIQGIIEIPRNDSKEVKR